MHPSLPTIHPREIKPHQSMEMTKTIEEAVAERGAPPTAAAASSVRTAEILLRASPMTLSLVALLLMLKNSQTTDYGSLSYSNLGAFTYLVYANGICAGYSLLSAFYAAAPLPVTMSRAWVLFLSDQVMTYAVLAAGMVSAEVLYLAYEGDEEVTWSRACGVFGGFCRRASASVGVTFAAAGCYMLLSLLSSYRLFSSYDAPVPFVDGKGVEIASFPGWSTASYPA